MSDRNPGAEEEGRLVANAQAGDPEAFGQLVERYLDSAYGVAMSVLHHPEDAEDAVQNAFIRALERMDQLRPGSPFGPWFYRVLRTTCLNLRRSETLRSHEPLPAAAAGGSRPDVELEDTLRRERVLQALEALPEMQRMAVLLYDLEGYTHREVADILGVAVGTSRAHVHHGRRALRQILGHAVRSRDGGTDDE